MRILERIKKTLKVLGPGLITGASDDDPSGIATYSQAGARFGPKLLWTAVLTYPLMVAIQEMCARIGLVTDRGLMGVIKKYYSRWILWLILLISFTSITLNIGADIAGMGAVGELLVPSVPSWIFSVALTLILLYAVVFWNYRRIAFVMKFLCLALFCYLIIPFIADTDWSEALYSTVIPTLEWNSAYFMALVGILGTTISPYLFFWQASMEVEEENQQKQFQMTEEVLSDMRKDVRIGLLLTNLVFYFVILSTGAVLFHAGIHQIDTVEQAAEALRPLAGNSAYLLFALGILGTGALAVPVLAGTLSYMMAEVFDWPEGLDKKFFEAKGFYLTLIISMLLGLGINFLGLSPVKILIYTAVLYGMIAPVVIALILHICNNRKIMGNYTNSTWMNILGAITLLLMTAAVCAMAYFFFLSSSSGA